ncbi:Nn.00g024730.m01.CDS01 [Neocucurbitaria sp. VM-36]
MVGLSFDRRKLWQYSHSASIVFAVLLFTAGLLCVLLWTNDIVHTDTSAGVASTSTFTQFSPAVSTFSITYNVAIFGTAWNAIFFVTLLVLERDALPLSTPRLRYKVEKAACIVAFAGNAIYSVACIALMATLARLAADASSTPQDFDDPVAVEVASSATERRAGQGMTAAMAGLAAAAAVWACVMDVLQAQNSRHRRVIKEDPLRDRPEAERQA